MTTTEHVHFRKSYLAVVLAGFLICAAIVDFLTFAIVAGMYGKPSDTGAYLDHRFGTVTELVSFAPELPNRDYIAEPLTEGEKKRFGRRMSLALPDPQDGWTKSAFSKAHFWSLRPDLESCTKHDEDVLVAAGQIGALRKCPPGFSGDGFFVYSKDSAKIAIMVRYLPPADGVSNDKLVKSAKLPAFASANFAKYGEDRSLSLFMLRKSWAFGQLPMVQHNHDGPAQFPRRLYARKDGHGVVDVFAVSNAPAADVKALLSGMNFAFLDAMLAKPTAD